MRTIQRGVRNVLRSPIRLVLVVALLGTSLMFVAAMFALNASAQQRLADARGQIGTGIDVRPAGSFGFFGGGGTLTAAQVTTITHTPGVASASEQITEQYSGTAIKGAVVLPNRSGSNSTSGQSGNPGFNRFNDNGTIPPTIYGFTPGQSPYALINGSVATLTSGRNFAATESNADVALTSSALAKTNNWQVGSTFSLQNTTFTLVGLISTGSSFGDNTIILPLQTAQRVYSVSGVSAVSVTATSDTQANAVVNALKSALGSGVDVTSQSQQYTQTLAALRAAQANIFTTLIVAIVVAALVVLFAVLLIVRERVREIGLLKAIGASNWQVISQFIVEVVSMSGISAIVAAVLLGVGGGAIASMFNIAAPSRTGFRGGFGGGGFGGGGFGGTFQAGGARVIASANQTPFSAGLTPSAFGLIVSFGLLLAILASVIPAWYVTRIKPAKVLRAE